MRVLIHPCLIHPFGLYYFFKKKAWLKYIGVRFLYQSVSSIEFFFNNTNLTLFNKIDIEGIFKVSVKYKEASRENWTCNTEHHWFRSLMDYQLYQFVMPFQFQTAILLLNLKIIQVQNEVVNETKFNVFSTCLGSDFWTINGQCCRFYSHWRLQFFLKLFKTPRCQFCTKCQKCKICLFREKLEW